MTDRTLNHRYPSVKKFERFDKFQTVQRPEPFTSHNLVSQEKLDQVVSLVDQISHRFEKSANLQNQRLKSLESSLSTYMERLINVVLLIGQGVSKIAGLSNAEPALPIVTLADDQDQQLQKTSPEQNKGTSIIRSSQKFEAQKDREDYRLLVRSREKISQRETRSNSKKILVSRLKQYTGQEKGVNLQIGNLLPSSQAVARLSLPNLDQYPEQIKASQPPTETQMVGSSVVAQSALVLRKSDFNQQNQQKPKSEVLNQLKIKSIKDLVGFDAIIEAADSSTDLSSLMRTINIHIGSTFRRQTQKNYRDYASGKMSYKDMRIEFSWAIMNYALDLNNSLSFGKLSAQYGDTSNSKNRFADNFDIKSKEVLQFLISKYPPSKSKITDTELSKRITEVKRHTEFQFDILRNAQFAFKSQPGQTDFTRQIKTFINRLISQTKKEFPTFTKTMKTIFVQRENSIYDDADFDEKDVEYLIGSKISESTPLYSEQELETPGLKLKSHQILRILVKWLEEMMSVLKNPSEKVLNNRTGFKHLTMKLPMSLNKKRKERLCQNLSMLWNDINEPAMQKLKKQQLSLIVDLMMLSQKGFEGYQYLDHKEVIVAKLSQYFSQCAETFTLQMLNSCLQSLNAVRGQYTSDLLESNIDLVTFGVMDLLRCKCIGSKKQIFRIFKEIQEGHNNYFQIIRIKNKLNQTTRDILINLKLKNSFLICEIQLALGEGQQQVNDHFCHYLYELQRSSFPLLFECSNILIKQDPRVNYFTSKRRIKFCASPSSSKLPFAISPDGQSMLCQSKHAPCKMQYRPNNTPFCCNSCLEFIASFSYSIEYLRCPECQYSLCPYCLLTQQAEFKRTYVQRYVDRNLLLGFFSPRPYYMSFCEKKALNQQIHKYFKEAVLNPSKLTHPEYCVIMCFDSIGVKSLTCKSFEKDKDGNIKFIEAFYTLDTLRKDTLLDSDHNWTTMLAPVAVETHTLEQLRFYQKFHPTLKWHQLEEAFWKHKVTKVKCIPLHESKKVLILDAVEDQSQIRALLSEREIIAHIKEQNQKGSDMTIQISSKGLSHLQILDHISAKSKVRSINLWENNLTEVSKVLQMENLEQLNLRENRLTTVPELPRLKSLQHLNLQGNQIGPKLSPLSLELLTSLDLSNNNLVDVSQLANSKFPQLRSLLVSKNRIKQLPRLDLPKLVAYFFSGNQISSIAKVAASNLPSIFRIWGYNNCIEGSLPVLDFKGLTYLSLNQNLITDVSNLSLMKLQSLEQLDLSNNKISGSLPPIKMAALNRLILDQNKLERFAQPNTWSTPKLTYISLASNAISGEVPPIANIPGLKIFNVKHNKITGLNNLGALDYGVTQIQQIDLSHNQITGPLPKFKSNTLSMLNLSHNYISEAYLLQHCRLPVLQVLDISSNKIRKLPLLFMEQLQELKVDDNQLREVAFLSQLHLVPRLKNFSYKNNPIEGTCEWNIIKQKQEEGDSKDDFSIDWKKKLIKK